MSDYEGDWEEPSRTYSKPLVVPGVPPDPATNYIVPKGQSLVEAQALASRAKQKPKRNIPQLPENYRPALQEILGKRRGGPSITNGVINRPPPDRQNHDIQSQARDLGSYKLYQSSPDHPTSTVHLSQPWSWFVKVTSRTTDARQIGLRLEADIARDRLSEICVSTAAFIATPDPEENTFKIWGKEDQVARAKDQLQIWLSDLSSKKQQQPLKAWPKSRAVDGRVEDRLARQRIQDELDRANPISSDIPMPFEAYLLWPEGYDLEAFLGEYNDNVLDTFRRTFTCSITVTSIRPKFIKIGSFDRDTLFTVYNRVVGLMKELVSQRKQGLQVTHFSLPSIDNALEAIETEKITLGNMQAYLPKLTGHALSPDESSNWAELKANSDKRNRSTTKKYLQECLNSLHIPGKHVRMRVSFGQIALLQLKHPANGQNYAIEEFISMTRLGQTRTTQIPLQTSDPTLVPNYSITEYLDRELGTPDISWVVRFDFRGTANFNGLRLEKEFEPSHIAGDEPIVKATRWLDYDETTERFQLEHIDLEKIGWRINVGAVNYYENERVKQGLGTFERSVNFKPMEPSIKFSPSRRSVFPPGQTELDCVYETTIAHYNIPNSRGSLEIRRCEAFPQRGRGGGSKPITVEWQAQYYFRDWDNLMAEFSSLERGQDVSWSRAITTFFPKKLDDNDPKSLPNGWNHFNEEICYIQTILTAAMKARTHDKGKQVAVSDSEDGQDLDLLNSPMAHQLLNRAHK